MKRLYGCLGMSVVLCFGWLTAVTSACPVATGVAVAVPVLSIASTPVQIAAPAVVAPVVAAPILAAPVVTSVAVPALSVLEPVAVLSSPVVVEKVRVRGSRRVRTPVRSFLFR